MRPQNELERQRVRRTLTEVKLKLEEALRLSRELNVKGKHGKTASHHRR
jgi:hypothetical protein